MNKQTFRRKSTEQSYTFERIVEQAPVTFDAKQLRMFLRLLLNINPYEFLEEVAAHFASNDENEQPPEEEILVEALEGTADEKLNGFALRIVLSDHVGIPHENQVDLLAEADAVFTPKENGTGKPTTTASKKPKSAIKSVPKKSATTRKAA